MIFPHFLAVLHSTPAALGSLAWIDWVIVIGYLMLSVGVGLSFVKKGGRDMTSFFLSGRDLVWPVAGVSMLATSFAADTPLWVSGLVRQQGISSAWQFWAPVIGTSLCAVAFARWWRRAGVLTDIELIELRYSGKPAAVLRGWNGFFGALIMCPLIIAWVTKAMDLIAREALGLPPQWQKATIFAVLALALLSCAFSGLDGVIYSDLMLFFMSVIGSLALAWFVVAEAGGLHAMVDALRAGAASPKALDVAPTIGNAMGEMSAWNAFGYFAIIWIGSAGSGGYTVQRLMACKDSRHAGLAMAMFSVVYFGLLAWPWIVTALGSLVLLPVLPEGVSHEGAYLRVARMVLPVGFQGILFAALTAAFISSINSLLNWGSSYIVNDLYRRFLVRTAGVHHYVTVGRIATVVLALIGGIFAMKADSIQQLLQISYVVGGAVGMVSVLRWLWPGLTAMGELAAVVVGWVLGILVALGLADQLFGAIFHVPDGVSFSADYRWMGARVFGSSLLATMVAAIVSWIGPQTDPAHLAAFAQRVQMPVIFWGRVLRRAGLPAVGLETVRRTLFSWALLLSAVLLVIFGIGIFVAGSGALGGGCIVGALALLGVVSQRLRADARNEGASS